MNAWQRVARARSDVLCHALPLSHAMRPGSLCLRLLVCIGALLAFQGALGAPQPLSFTLHNLHFEQFDPPDANILAVVHAVHTDQRGRLWIGTEGGLYLYDGHEVRRFNENAGERSRLPDYFAKAIAETPDGTIWIGTWGGGLAYYDNTMRSTRMPEMHSADAAPDAIRFDRKIWSMAADKNGDLWLGTFSSGLFHFDPESGELSRAFQLVTGDLTGNRIDSIFVDDSNRVWFAPYRRGLHVLDADTGEPVKTIDTTNLQEGVRGGFVRDIAAFPDGRIVILYEHSLKVLDENGAVLAAFDIPWTNVDGALMEAQPYGDNSVLVGTGIGTWYLDTASGEAFRIPTGKRTHALEPGIVWSIHRSENGDLYVAGTSGVWIVPAHARQFWTIAGPSGQASPFLKITRAITRVDDKLFLNSGSSIYEISFDGRLASPRILKGRLLSDTPIGDPNWMTPVPGQNGFWITGDEAVYLGPDGVVTPMKNSDDRFFHTMLYDPRSKKLLLHGDDGLHVVDPVVDVVQIGPGSIPVEEQGRQYDGTRLSFGRHDDIWVGSFTGITRFDRSSHETLPVFAEGYIPEDWNNPFVTFIRPRTANEIIIGSGDGLFLGLLDEDGAIMRLEREFVGTPLAGVAFSGAFAAGQDTLLLYSDAGLVRYNAADRDHVLLADEDGVPNYQPYLAGFHAWPDGLAILSGTSGPTLFRPHEIDFAIPRPELQITDVMSFRDNDTRVWPLTNGLEFQYMDKVIRFKFGLLDYLMPENNRYKIRLEGFSEDWLEIGRLTEFSFTNLDAGSYRLEVRATDGLVEVPRTATLDFTVLPPWWQTWWAYALYAIVILGSLAAYLLSLQRKLARERDISQRLREADRIKSHFLEELEEKVELATQDLRHAVEAMEIKNIELDAAQRRALDASRLKSEFLANMSHEIRTPMNGILGFTQLLGKSPLDHDQRDYVDTIGKSATSLLGIINDVLDVSKIEAGKLMLDNVGFDLYRCMSDTLDALTPIAYEKNLELICHIDPDLPSGLRGDPVRLRQMVTNLVGNAVKFTDAGHVLVRVDRVFDSAGEARLEISVTDTGRGISAEDRARLFRAFERGNVDLARRHTGTGLGLVITKKLCEAMGGYIELDSVPGQGTRIVIDMPLIPDRNPENRYGYGKPLAGHNVLLVEANELSREAIQARLLHWGASVTAFPGLPAEPVAGVDIAVIGIERHKVGDTRALQALCEQLPPGLPRVCLASTVDHDALRSIGKAGGGPCVPKVGHKEAQLRRILGLLGMTSQELEIDAAPPTTQRLSGLRVIVADDNRINRYFLKKILELHGARITEADCGEAVLRVLEEQREIDIVLLDIHMPDIDGLEVARRIRETCAARLPLLAVSANIQPETYEAAIAAGINDYLLKPIDESKLVEAVLEWTGRENPVTSDE